MPDSPEIPGFAASGWETKETEPVQKHEVAIEQDVGTAVAERSDFLKGVWDVKNREDGQNQKQLLADWKKDLPEHKEFIEQFPFDKDISDMIDGATMWGRNEDIHKMQDLCKSVLEQYGGNDWNELSEQNKRYVRMAEMTILMIDAKKLEKEIRTGKVDFQAAEGLVDKLKRYSESSDIPQNYKDKVINSVLNNFDEAQAPTGKRTNPSSRNSKVQEMLNPKTGQQSAPGQAGGRPPESFDRSETAVGEDADAIETEYNPATGSYEPVGDEYVTPEAAPGETKRLTYDPGVAPSGGADISPSAPSGGGEAGGGAE